MHCGNGCPANACNGALVMLKRLALVAALFLAGSTVLTYAQGVSQGGGGGAGGASGSAADTAGSAGGTTGATTGTNRSGGTAGNTGTSLRSN